ncbi:pitrilysin family protein [Proteinivorax hydrogeniformans]|uniref:Pitrilysin family protein n=1 Tax=Proteinivorax hydrogeniformans TaxID=1826727 RepID=A0AAU8HSJ2_9FIRM
MNAKFEKTELAPGVNLYLYPTDKYKTVSIRAFLYTDLEDETSKTAILPEILKKGTKDYPTPRELSKELAKLYGTRMGAGVTKRGETLLADFRMEMVSPKYLEDDSYVQKALKIFKDVIFDPALDDNKFNKTYVEIEKQNLKNRIAAVVNDKQKFAFMKAIENSCPDEAYRISKYGSVEELDKVNEANLYQHYEKIVNNNPMDFYVVGNFDKDKLKPLLTETFKINRQQVTSIKKPINSKAQPLNEIVHDMEVKQGRLVMVMKTPVTMNNNSYPALLMYNGILGGFTHSKLFQNVREKASLAYYAGSNIETLKGMVFLFAGIDKETYKETLDIMNQQLEDIKAGKISEKEMEYTLAGLKNSLSETIDEVGGQIGLQVDGGLVGRRWEIEELLSELKNVKKEDVVEVANSLEVDTIFFLRPKEEQ